MTEADAAALSYTGMGGVLVFRVEKFGPAEEGGLRADDIIITIDRKTVRGKDDFAFQVQKLKSGAVVVLAVFRRGGQYQILSKCRDFLKIFHLNTILAGRSVNANIRRLVSLPSGAVVRGVEEVMESALSR